MKSVVSTILILLFAIISSAFLVTEKQKYKAFDERIFYFVSASSSKKTMLLEDKKELLKNLGGANVVYVDKGLSHLISSVYLDSESASEIKSNLSSYFPEADVLKLKIKRVSNKKILQIKGIVGAEEFIKYLYQLSNEYQDLQMSFLSGDYSDGKFLSEMLERKINLEKLLENIDKTTELAQQISGFGDLMSLQLTNFLSGFTIAKAKQNYICNYFVGFYLNYVELFECL